MSGVTTVASIRPATSASTRSGPRPRRPGSPSSSTSGAPATSSTRATSSNGLPDPAGLPRRRGELPLGRLHGHPPPADADPGHDDLRRRARAVPGAAHRRHRAGRHLGAVVDAADGVGLRRLRTATRSGCRRLRCARPTTSGARSASRRTPPKTWAGSSSRPAPRCACSRPTTPTSRAAESPFERFETSPRRRRRTVRQAFYCDNFLDLMGTAGPQLAGLTTTARRAGPTEGNHGGVGSS